MVAVAGSSRISTLAVRDVPDWSAPSAPPAPPDAPRFVLASYSVDSNGNVGEYNVLTQYASGPTWYNSDPKNPARTGGDQPPAGVFTQTDQGSYTYAFPTEDVTVNGSLILCASGVKNCRWKS